MVIHRRRSICSPCGSSSLKSQRLGFTIPVSDPIPLQYWLGNNYPFPVLLCILLFANLYPSCPSTYWVYRSLTNQAVHSGTAITWAVIWVFFTTVLLSVVQIVALHNGLFNWEAWSFIERCLVLCVKLWWQWLQIKRCWWICFLQTTARLIKVVRCQESICIWIQQRKMIRPVGRPLSLLVGHKGCLCKFRVCTH